MIDGFEQVDRPVMIWIPQGWMGTEAAADVAVSLMLGGGVRRAEIARVICDDSREKDRSCVLQVADAGVGIANGIVQWVEAQTAIVDLIPLRADFAPASDNAMCRLRGLAVGRRRILRRTVAAGYGFLAQRQLIAVAI